MARHWRVLFIENSVHCERMSTLIDDRSIKTDLKLLFKIFEFAGHERAISWTLLYCYFAFISHGYAL